MSMVTLTIIQLAAMFCAYLSATIGLPAFVFGRKMRGRRAPERLMLYFMTGNFYLINLVYLLQLLKISCPATLILGTVLPAFAARVGINDIPVLKAAADLAGDVRRLVGGQLGRRTALYKVAGCLRRQLARFGRWLWYYLSHRFLDCALSAALLLLLWWMYGSNLLDQFGYKASDLLVHNYWINAMNENHIFVAGVYPHGFHCIVYYLHAVFGFETFNILRLFAFVQNVMLHLMLLCFLRLCCKSRYTAYGSTFLYVIGQYIRSNTYSRLYATLPQEFGIIFIFPTVYFGFAYFETRRRELREAAEEKKEAGEREVPKPLCVVDLEAEPPKKGRALGKGIRRKAGELPRGRRKRKRYPGSWLHLAGFCMSFSMTLTVHFYGTMIAGIFCLAMAAGYFFLFCRKKYFVNVVVTCFLSVAIAVLPMLLAFLGGTPLQGSLGWGMNIIKGAGSSDDKPGTGSPSDLSQQFTTIFNGEEVTVYQGVNEEELQKETEASEPGEAEAKPGAADKLKGLVRRAAGFAKQAWENIYNALCAAVFVLPDREYVYWIMASFLVLLGLGAVYLVFRQYCYGGMLISAGLYMLFLCVLMTAKTFGLPPLMDSNRGSIYFAYSMPVAVAFLVDGALYLPFFAWRGKFARAGRFLMNSLSFACAAAMLFYTAATGQVRTPRTPGGQQTNEAVTCLTNIIRGEEDFTWTIVSANDEFRMGWDHGYHYETIEFLEKMEGALPDAMIRIPTRVVYIFIEKIPIDYNISYAGSGQRVSAEGADRELPANRGIRMYQGEQRWVLMSRMYYWAQAFQRLYPDEMDVYLETDNFVCYRVEQNPYRLYNFAINYGFNDRPIELEE